LCAGILDCGTRVLALHFVLVHQLAQFDRHALALKPESTSC
jgi:hypothetical protein